MALKHHEFLGKGARVFAMSADTAGQNSAVMEKLALTFPVLSDPDRSRAITPLGFADEKDPRQIARPSVLIVDPDGEEVFRFVGRDFADRPDEDRLLEAVAALDLPPTTQEPPVVGEAKPGKKAYPLEGLSPYFTGAGLAVYALRQRHRDISKEFSEDAKAYGQMVARYREALSAVEDRRT